MKHCARRMSIADKKGAGKSGQVATRSPNWSAQAPKALKADRTCSQQITKTITPDERVHDRSKDTGGGVVVEMAGGEAVHFAHACT